MFNLFKTKLTAQELHTAIMLYNSELLANVEKYHNPDANLKELHALENTGFVASENIRILQGGNGLCFSARDIEIVKPIFPKALFIREPDFIGLLHKYGLTCGMVKDYTGSIPLKNLLEVEEAYNTIRNMHSIEHWSINQRYVYVSTVTPIDGTLGKNPWNKKDTLNLMAYPFLRISRIISSASPTNSINGDNLNETDFLIAAPQEFIKHRAEVLKKMPTVNRPKPKIDDPIVFQILPCGIIMIHTIWGEEANDPIFKDKNKVL